MVEKNVNIYTKKLLDDTIVTKLSS